jgi:DNA polymerase III epsilon subunit-like protein
MEKILEEKYVVLDVETNGLSSIRDDLLSISIYKPDDKKMYNQFLPLELNNDVYTTYINGIKKRDLKGKKHLTQDKFDELITNFELDSRTILTYGNIDEKFIKKYLERRHIRGFEKLTFYNFKHDIISSSFSGGNVTKDNLCNVYGIANITEIHTGANDCILEWELFKKINGKKLLITNNLIYEFNEDYIIPVSYLCNYPNFKYCFNNFPKIKCAVETVKTFNISSRKLKKFDTNINGMIIEHLINKMLLVEKVNSIEFLINNKKKLKYIGKLPSPYNEIAAIFNDDGTITATQEKDKMIEKQINKCVKELKLLLEPLVQYLQKDLFKTRKIYSQELVISEDNKILALCDLSNENTVLEIKTFSLKLDKVKYQLYYESKGRDTYILNIDWLNIKKGIEITISKVKFAT